MQDPQQPEPSLSFPSRVGLKPPYFAVIFTSTRPIGPDGAAPSDASSSVTYSDTSVRMLELAQQQPGFLGVESVSMSITEAEHEKDAQSPTTVHAVTISYWRSKEDVNNWKLQAEHVEAQRNGKAKWYQQYRVRVCEVQREYGFETL